MYCQETYKGYSPWGGIQYTAVIARGLKAVETAGHGGFMVTKEFAEKYLSEACKKRGKRYSNYLCYGEDCAYAILCFDIVDVFGDRMKPERITLEEYKHGLLETLSFYYPEYLLEIGIEPLKKEYQLYLQRKQRDEMRKNKHKDLILSASRVNNEIVKVWTADGNQHFVSRESYEKAFDNSETISIFLSGCDEVEYEEK